MPEPDPDEGGDPACWAHLLADDPSPTSAIDLAALAAAAPNPGVAWSASSDDLNVNLAVFPDGGGVPEHVNADLDVLLVGIAGEGVAVVDGTAHDIRGGAAVVIPKGAARATLATSPVFAYLTCHRRRPGLLAGG